MNKFLRIGFIGFGITSIIAVSLDFFELPYSGTMPVFLVWATFLLIGLTKNKKKQDDEK